MTIDRKKIARELAKLESTMGELNPHSVVDAARDPRSPLHSHFEWDDTVAAESHRLAQARVLIKVVQVVRESTTYKVPVKVYVRDPSKPGSEVGYRSIASIRQSPERECVLDAELGRVVAAIRRAAMVAAAMDVDPSWADAMIEQVQRGWPAFPPAKKQQPKEKNASKVQERRIQPGA